MKGKSKSSAVLPRLRIVVGDEIAFGPGKADLLALIAKTGSIGEAARQMDMSYMRAWTLVKTMNGCFKEPLIEAVRGGNKRGGAKLTPSGQQVLKLYQEMERGAAKGAQRAWNGLQSFLRN